MSVKEIAYHLFVFYLSKPSGRRNYFEWGKWGRYWHDETILLLYADDIVLFANTQDELQHLLDILQDYCARNRLTVNTSKTKVTFSEREEEYRLI